MHDFQGSILIMPDMDWVDPSDKISFSGEILIYAHRLLEDRDLIAGYMYCEGCGEVKGDRKVYLTIPLHKTDLMEGSLPYCEVCLESTLDTIANGNPWDITAGFMSKAPAPRFLAAGGVPWDEMVSK